MGMHEWIEERWQRMTTKPCSGCGEAVSVSDYRETGETRKGSWWEGGTMELECPICGERFWTKR